jgi:hypothetical protein
MGGKVMSIPFTQFLRPNGVPRPIVFETTPEQAEVEANALRIIEAGYRFEAEELSTGDISMTIAGPDEQGEEVDVAIEVVPNGSAVVPAVERLVAKGVALILAGRQ